MNKLSGIFGFLAILLTNVMCASVAFHYARMLCGISHLGYSAPACVALLGAVPYLIGVGVCVIVALKLKKQGK